MRPASKITPKLVVAIVEQARIEAAEEAALRIPPPLAAAVRARRPDRNRLDGPKLLGKGAAGGGHGRGGVAGHHFHVQQGTGSGNRPRRLPPILPYHYRQRPSPSNLEAPSIETKSEPAGSHDAPIAGEADDPEKTVQAFVDQNRKVAEGQLKSLKGEAERLRARLQKVEAGIRRWESLLAALEKSEAAAKDLPPDEPGGGPQCPATVPAEGRRQHPTQSALPLRVRAGRFTPSCQR